MHTILAIRTIGTEAGQVEFAEFPPNVSLAASGTFLAETLVVLLAHGQLTILLDVDIQTFIAILTEAVLIVELAFAHLSKIVLMEIVAGIAFLAKSLQPVFADVVIILPAEVVLRGLSRRWMSIGTATAKWA